MAMAEKKQQTYVRNVIRKQEYDTSQGDNGTNTQKTNDDAATLTSMNLFSDVIDATSSNNAIANGNEANLPPKSDTAKPKVKHPRIVVAGCRDYLDTRHVEREMKKIVKKLTGCDYSADVEIVEGGARGVDTIARNVAEKHKWKCCEFKAQWCLYGRRAGPTRNAKMARYASESEFPCLLAFWDMQSRGTGNMIRVARKNGLDVTIIDIRKRIRRE